MTLESVKKVAFCTLGCKVNQYETDAMTELFAARGYKITDFSDFADVYIINTCTVTNMADRKSRQMLHRARKKNPDGIVAAAGCYVQAAGEKLLEDGQIDLIIGNNRKNKIVDIVEACIRQKAEAAKSSMEDDTARRGIISGSLIDISHTNEYEQLRISKVSEHTRACIKIQDGCNQFCSYCIIPFARGRVRSRQPEDIRAEVLRLAENGYKEVVLTGIHISSYGLDFEGESYNQHPENGGHLLDLIESIAAVDGIRRIRLGSLEPRIITEDFARRLSGIPKVCAHFHLSLQSGCDATLARMNRHYTTEEYQERCAILRKYFYHPALTTDVIVGFPGETEEEFEQTRGYLAQMAFAQMHIFKYSRRSGTKAAAMKDQIDEQVKTRRSDSLLALEKEMADRYIDGWTRPAAGEGVDRQKRRMEILLEEKVMLDKKAYMTGHSKEYIRVAVPEGNLQSNDIITVVSEGKRDGGFLLCRQVK